MSNNDFGVRLRKNRVLNEPIRFEDIVIFIINIVIVQVSICSFLINIVGRFTLILGAPFRVRINLLSSDSCLSIDLKLCIYIAHVIAIRRYFIQLELLVHLRR